MAGCLGFSKNDEERQYLDLIKRVIDTGSCVDGRNGKTLSVFGASMRFSLKDGQVPLLTTKRLAWKTCFKELIWFLKGQTDGTILSNQNVHIWDANGTREFLNSRGLVSRDEYDLGPIYGFQWRHFNAPYRGADVAYGDAEGVDQLAECIRQIREDPTSRRIFMSGWNPQQLKEMCLPPCHVSYQFYVNSENELSCMMYQRSGDMFLGVPFNIASVALLTHILAHITEKKVGSISIVIGDAHIYESHIDAVKLQLSREPRQPCTLQISSPAPRKNPEDFQLEDFQLVDYVCFPAIKAEMVA